MTEDLGQKIHRVILNQPKLVDILNKEGKIVHTFNVGLLSVKEVVQISRIVYGSSKSEKQDIATFHKLIVEESEKVISVIAIMFKSRSMLPMWYIKRLIRNNVDSDNLNQLTNLVYDAMDIKNFLNSIILTTGMSLIKQEEIIASKTELTKTRKKKEKV